MNGKRSVITQWAIRLMVLLLLGYTSFRTYHFLSLTLDDDNKFLAILGLVAFDAGLLGWSEYYMYGARGTKQKALSMVMSILSLVGVLLVFGADTSLGAARASLVKDNPWLTQLAIWSVTVIVGAHISAGILNEMFDPEKQKEDAESEAEDETWFAAFRQARSDAKILASEVAPTIGASLVNRVRIRFTNLLKDNQVYTQEQVKQLIPPKEISTFPADVSGPAPSSARTELRTCANPNCPRPNKTFIGPSVRKYCSPECKHEAKRLRG